MSMRIIATILTIACFGSAFLCWSWLSIDETVRHRRRKALEAAQVNRDRTSSQSVGDSTAHSLSSPSA
jgi:hypothetical protein